MKDLDRALIDIETIRSQVAAGSMFQGFGPAVVAATGVLALLTTFLQMAAPSLFGDTSLNILVCWVGVAVVAALAVGWEAVARSRRRHGGLADQMVLNAIEQFLPAGFAGFVVAAVFYSFHQEALWSLPGLWQIFVALGLFTAARSLPATVRLVAAWYFLAGVCVLIIGANSQSVHPMMMGVPFTVGQLLFALFLHIAEVTSDER